MKQFHESIDRLIDHAIAKLGLVEKNVDYVRNGVLDALGVAFESTGAKCGGKSIDALLADFVKSGTECGVIPDGEGDRYCDIVMGILSLKPDEIQHLFEKTLDVCGTKAATDMFYGYCVNNYYVRKAKLDKNPRFDSNGLIITINKAKPEFRDAKKAASGNAVSGGYPSCSICHANEGFGGRDKRTLRTIDIMLGNARWFWQYSPYGYFNEHGIAVNYEHTPMHIDRQTFVNLVDFVDMFPHYFIGCNAPLPRIGGSVLAHDHYQGGGEVLPLHRAEIKTKIKDKKSDAVIGILDWPGTVIRVKSKNRNDIIDISERIRRAWVKYNNPELGIIAEDADGVHSAISPTVIKTADGYEMNIILRNNVTSEKYPDGVFHAHPEFHSIKKESIGLIEAQGLFILPGRLEGELSEIENIIASGEALSKEFEQFRLVYDETKALYASGKFASAHDAMKDELGSICRRILENTAVFKDEKHLIAFLKSAVEA